METRGKIGIIGLGLIGGSIAIALKGKRDVVGMSRNPETTAYALKQGIISSIAERYEDFADCAVVIVCTPIASVRKTVEDVARVLGDSVIISDVGSVKGMLTGLRGRIIGGHPMAGTEQSGITAAKERLLENAYYILTDYNSNASDLEYMRGLVKEIGAVPIIMTAEQHDSLVGKISHMVHMAAYSLVNSAMTGDEEITGSGFMDTTRIASSSPEFWDEVARLNKDNITKELSKYISTLEGLRSSIERGESIVEFLRAAKAKRDRLSYKKKFMTEYVLYIDLPDRVGSVAKIVSRISAAGISLDNLTVMNSREEASGALRLEFKDEQGYTKAKQLLT